MSAAAPLDPARVDALAVDGAALAVVLLHPHPDYGGDRRNVVVQALFDALPASGIAAVRFDFASSAMDEGVADTIAALDLAAGLAPRVALAGYSFGAVIAAGVIDSRIERWVLVAPPLGALLRGADAAIGPDTRPKLVLSPAHDQFCPPEAAAAEIEGWAAATVEPVPSADHFLAGATAGVAARAVRFLSGE